MANKYCCVAECWFPVLRLTDTWMSLRMVIYSGYDTNTYHVTDWHEPLSFISVPQLFRNSPFHYVESFTQSACFTIRLLWIFWGLSFFFKSGVVGPVPGITNSFMHANFLTSPYDEIYSGFHAFQSYLLTNIFVSSCWGLLPLSLKNLPLPSFVYF